MWNLERRVVWRSTKKLMMPVWSRGLGEVEQFEERSMKKVLFTDETEADALR